MSLGLFGSVDDLLNAAVTQVDYRCDGPVAHPGLRRYADGRVAGGTCVGVLLDGLSQGALVVGHERSIENLTADLKLYSFLDMPSVLKVSAQNIVVGDRVQEGPLRGLVTKREDAGPMTKVYFGNLSRYFANDKMVEVER
jgi:hypothetical protein